MESCCELELTVQTFHSVLELVRDEPTAIIDDSSFDKIIDSLYDVCKTDCKFLDSVSRIEEIPLQLAFNINSKAASFGIRLLEIYIVFQKVCYQQYGSLLKQLTANCQPNILCAVLSVLKAIVSSHDGMCWLLEEQIHLLVFNQLCTSSSYFVTRITEDVIQCVLLSCMNNVVDKPTSDSELYKRNLDELMTYLCIESCSPTIPFTTLMRLASHVVSSGSSSDVMEHLFTCYWPFDKWFAQLATRTAEECHLILNLFETCIQNHW